MSEQGSGSGHRIRSEETWAAAREAYLGGASAAEVCERFDLGLSALRTRARGEGWRRRDLDDPDPDLASAEPEDEADPALTPAALAEVAAKRASRAVLAGRLREAQGWTRLHRDWRAMAAEADRTERETRLAERRLASAQAEADADRAVAEVAAEVRAAAIAARSADDEPEPNDGAELHGLHPLHPVFEPPPASAGRNRAERRKLARLQAWRERQAARDP